jgi:hypothetical protein
MGTTDDFFHADGRLPVVKDRLKSLVSEGAMLYAVLFNILADTIAKLDTIANAILFYVRIRG